MMMYGRITGDIDLNFTDTEWMGLVIGGDIAAAISIVANSVVLFIHAFMLWYRPVIVARLSLRMIVLSCIFNMIYCACQLVVDDVPSYEFSCRIYAYVLIVSDAMACMCLAMVGLNLVMIFVLKVSRSFKLELFYYFLILLCGVLVAVVPIAVNKRLSPNQAATCWYHYYFDGRLHSVFNWMWYYSWLLFSSVFAALCAVISLAFVVKKQGNFAGTLDMFSLRDKAQVSKINKLKRYSKNNTDVFKKIAKRCILYPLVPLISKSWGVSIVIAASQKANIPYPIFVIDRIFSCLLGLMVSCIYYTDPAISAVFKEGRKTLKRRYVLDYFCVRYQPGSDPTIESNKSHYPQKVKIIENPVTQTSPSMGRPLSEYKPEESLLPFGSITSAENSSVAGNNSFIGPHDTTHFHQYSVSNARRASVSFKPDVPSVEVHKRHHHTSSSKDPSQRRYSVISVTSTSGKTFLPNESILDNFPKGKGFSLFKKNRRVYLIPMRRVSEDSTHSQKLTITSNIHGYRKEHSEAVETLVPFQYPTGAKFLHWVLVNIFKVSPTSRRRESNATDESASNVQPTRVFRDYTDGSNPSSPQLTTINSPLHGNTPTNFSMTTSPKFSQSDPKSLFFDGSGEERFPKFTISSPTKNKIINSSEVSLMSSPLSPPRSRSRSSDFIFSQQNCDDSGCSSKSHPLRRVSSINIGSLYRGQYEKAKSPYESRPIATLQRTPSNSSSSRLVGLTKKVLNHGRGRSMSFSWGRLSRSPARKPSVAAVPTPPKSLIQPLENPSAVHPMFNIESINLPIAAASASQIKLGQKIDKHAFDSDIELKPQKQQQQQQQQQKQRQQQQKPKKSASIHSNTSISCPFPVELSPRPVLRKEKRKTSGLRAYSRQGSTSSRILKRPKSTAEPIRDKNLNRLSIFGEEVLSETSESDGNDANVVDHEDNILQQPIKRRERTKSMETDTTKYDSDDKQMHLSMSEFSNEERDGLSEGFTTIDFITNWQDHDNDDATRIMVYSEVWDIEEQFRTQVELAEAMAHF